MNRNREMMDRIREIDATSTPPQWMTTKRERKPAPPQAVDKCIYCGEKFTLPRSMSIDRYDKHGIFCTLRCAARYGTREAELKLTL